jgi:hypothetical protein
MRYVRSTPAYTFYANRSQPGASFKEEKSQNEMSGKQAGLSNDATSHSHPLHQNPEKSRKGEGVAETSKLQGTVSTNRPSVSIILSTLMRLADEYRPRTRRSAAKRSRTRASRLVPQFSFLSQVSQHRAFVTKAQEGAGVCIVCA